MSLLQRADGALPGSRAAGDRWILAAVALGWLFTLGLRFLVPTLLPQVKQTFGVGNAAAGLAVTVVWACYAVMQFPAGLFTDRIGERTAIAGSLALSAASLAALAAAPEFAVFLVAAGAFGLASGLYGPSRGTALTKAFPGEAGTALGVTLAAGSLGSAVIPLAAGVAVGAVGWRALVGVTVPCFLAVCVLTWTVLPDAMGGEDAAADGGGVRSVRAAVRAVPRAVRNRDVYLAMVALTAYLFAFQGLTAFYPTYLVVHEHLGQGVAAGLYALLFVGGGVSQLAVGSAADRFGTPRVLAAVAALAVVTLAVVPFVDRLAVWTVLTFLIGTRMAIAPVANAYVIEVLPDAVQGAAWGFLRTCLFLVAATGSAFVGVLGDADLFDAAFLALAALTAVSVVCFGLLSPRGQTG